MARLRKLMLAITACLMLSAASAVSCPAQTTAELQKYLKDLELTPEQIADIRAGKAFAKVLQSRSPNEIFVFGAVYVNATPDSYLKFATDFDRLRQLPGYIGLAKFSDPPQLSDLDSLTIDDDEVKAAKECKPGSCEFQLPADAFTDMQKTIDWSAPDAKAEATQMARKGLLSRLSSYRQSGNAGLGVYYDKHDPADVSQHFASLLSYVTVLPQRLPDLNHYLVDYPNGKASGMYDYFYWAKVKFGLKPTIRMVQVVVRPGGSSGVPYVVAEKQLYSSHYFRTALDLTFCVRPTDDTGGGFYLIRILGSDQAGLTGFKGSIVRNVATGKSASSLQKSLTSIKQALENHQNTN